MLNQPIREGGRRMILQEDVAGFFRSNRPAQPREVVIIDGETTTLFMENSLPLRV